MTHTKIFALIIGALALPSCCKYAPTQINKTKKTTVSATTQTKNPITATLSACDHLKTHDQFDNFEFLNLTLKNSSDTHYTITGNTFSQPLASATIIQKEAPYGYGIYAIPTACSLVGLLFYWPVFLPLTICTSLSGMYASTTATEHQHKKLVQLLLEPDKTYTIPAHNTRSFLIAFSADTYKPTLSCSVTNSKNKESFSIKLSLHARQITEYSFD